MSSRRFARTIGSAALSIFALAACSDSLPTESVAPDLNGTPDAQIVTLCKTGPEGTSATFSVSATGGQLLLGNQVTINNVMPFGVNPPACVEVWRSTSTAVEQVTIAEIAMTPGTYLNEIVVFAMDYTIDAQAGSATVSVDNVNGSTVIFKNAGTPEQPGMEGCTPGFWKQRHHFQFWTGYTPTDSFSSVFGVAYEGNLLDAVSAGGGGVKALARHAVAALLNSASSTVDYPLSTANVISAVQTAFASGNYETTKNMLEGYNELGCDARQ